MSFATALAQSLGRSVGITLLTWMLAVFVARCLSTETPARQKLTWTLLWLPFLMPGMFIGYAYNGWALFLANSNWLVQLAKPSENWSILASIRNSLLLYDWLYNEVLLWLLLIARLLPIGVVFARFAPPPLIGPAAKYLLGLLRTRKDRSDNQFLIDNGVWHSFAEGFRRAGPGCGVIFLAGFQEFELAARLARPAWTVWLIDAQATGVGLGQSLVFALVGAGLQLVVLIPALWSLANGSNRPWIERRMVMSLSGQAKVLTVGALVVGFLLTCVVPGLWIGTDFPMGMQALFNRRASNLQLGREICVGLLVAGLATALATMAVWLTRIPMGARTLERGPTLDVDEPLMAVKSAALTETSNSQSRNVFHHPSAIAVANNQAEIPSAIDEQKTSIQTSLETTIDRRQNERRTTNRWSYGIRLCGIIAGGLGALPVSLAILWTLQSASVGSWLRSYIPWIIAQAVFLFPRAVLFDQVIRRSVETPALHLARLLAQSDLPCQAKAGDWLIWNIIGIRRFAVAVLLWLVAYLDLATGQLLAPTGMVSAPVSLYIQMHYGRNAVLSAMTFTAMLVPLLVASLGLIVRPVASRFLR